MRRSSAKYVIPWLLAFALLLVSYAARKPSKIGLFKTSSDIHAKTTATVTRVVDGDTIILDHQTSVRLIGIDAPEWHDNKKRDYDIQHSGITAEEMSHLGRMATDKLATHLLNQDVRLTYGHERFDTYGRTLAYVWMGDELVNQWLVEQGLARAYTRFPFQYAEEFVRIQTQAVESHRGIWQALTPQQF